MKAELVKRQDRWDLYGEDGSKIASSAPNPIGKLSIKNCQEIENGYDLDELADEHCNRLYHEGNINWDHYRVHFKLGFQKALELLGDKKYSVLDIQNVIDSNEDSLVYQTISENGDISFCLDEDVLIQSLQQTEWDVEIEQELIQSSIQGEAIWETKLDADGCLILKRIV